MQTISINFIVPQGWHELSDKQLRYVYQLIADNFATDDNQCQREQSGGTPIDEPARGAFFTGIVDGERGGSGRRHDASPRLISVGVAAPGLPAVAWGF